MKLTDEDLKYLKVDISNYSDEELKNIKNTEFNYKDFSSYKDDKERYERDSRTNDMNAYYRSQSFPNKLYEDILNNNFPFIIDYFFEEKPRKEYFKNKLLNEYSKEQLDELSQIHVEDIREYIKPHIKYQSAANGDYNVVYMDRFPILDEIANKLKNQVDICISCEIKAILKDLFREITFDELRDFCKKVKEDVKKT